MLILKLFPPNGKFTVTREFSADCHVKVLQSGAAKIIRKMDTEEFLDEDGKPITEPIYETLAVVNGNYLIYNYGENPENNDGQT